MVDPLEVIIRKITRKETQLNIFILVTLSPSSVTSNVLVYAIISFDILVVFVLENISIIIGRSTEGHSLENYTPPTFLFFFFSLSHTACRILLPWPGIEPMATAGKVPSPNHLDYHGTLKNHPLLRASHKTEHCVKASRRACLGARLPGFESY